MIKLTDSRVRLDKITKMKITDIQRWTGEKENTETVRQSVNARWQHLNEEVTERLSIVKKVKKE